MSDVQIPELLPESEREWAHELFRKYGGDKSFSMWVEMVQMVGVEKAWDNILKSYNHARGKMTKEFKQVMFTALMHHLDKQTKNN